MEGSRADVIADATALSFADGAFEEIYAGHFLEHLEPADADRFLAACLSLLKPGGRIGVVVPDMRAVLKRYTDGPALSVEFIPNSVTGRVWVKTSDLDDVCSGFIYSTLQESPHKWCYDEATLARRMQKAGFGELEPINRWFDPHIPVGAWYQCGFYGRKPL